MFIIIYQFGTAAEGLAIPFQTAVAEYDDCINIPGLQDWHCNPSSKSDAVATCRPISPSESEDTTKKAPAPPDSLAGVFRCGGATGAPVVAVTTQAADAIETREETDGWRDESQAERDEFAADMSDTD